MTRRFFLSLLAALLITVFAMPLHAEPVMIVSSADGSLQPSLWFPAPGEKPRPLLVGLHFWSFTYDQGEHEAYRAFAFANGWHFIYPHFRGKNMRPEAAGSHLAIADVIDAVRFAREVATVDSSRIYLVGASGGGHMALLMAGRNPELWAGVSAWVGISDLTAWYAETRSSPNFAGYAVDIEAICGGNPLDVAAAAVECAARSPLTYLANARLVNLDINVGITDGHTGSVPVSQSLRAFNAVAAAHDQLTEEEIDWFLRREVPWWLRAVYPQEERAKVVLFRRRSGQVTVTVFDGGHEIDYGTALRWLAEQRKVIPTKRRIAAKTAGVE